jgi:hypothetical protein
MNHVTLRSLMATGLLGLCALMPASPDAAPEGHMAWGVMLGPVIEPAFLNGVGPRPAVDGLGLIANHAYSAPYEDLSLKRR